MYEVIPPTIFGQRYKVSFLFVPCTAHHMATDRVRLRRYCFTYYPEEDLLYETDDGGVYAEGATLLSALEQWKDAEGKPILVAGVWQVERCPKNGRLHYQGYFKFTQAVAYSALQQYLPGLHVERCKGNDEKNKAYCTKEDTRVAGPWFFHEELLIGGPGARSDLLGAKRVIEEGISEKEFAMSDEHFPTWIRHGPALSKYRAIVATLDLSIAYQCWFVFGPPGVGKTQLVKQFWKDDGLYIYKSFNPTKPEWSKYIGERNVLVDDANSSKFTLDTLLTILDPLREEPFVVDGFLERPTVVARRFFFTFMYDWRVRWYPNVLPRSIWQAAITRRVTHWFWYDKSIDGFRCDREPSRFNLSIDKAFPDSSEDFRATSEELRMFPRHSQ